MSPVSTSSTVMLDALDNQILHAVILSPRAPFAVIAAALETSEQTVARRYRRLVGDGMLRVMGLVRPESAGIERWLLRVHCRPDAAGALAEALAGRADVNWVSISAGGSEVLCSARTSRVPTTAGSAGSSSGAAHDGLDLLMHRLPRTTQVHSFEANAVLHQFGQDSDWTGFSPGLSAAARAVLRSTAPTAPSAPASVQDDDEPLLRALAADGRASIRQLSDATGWSAHRVSRRVEALTASGSIYFDVDLDIERLGFRSMTYIWVTVAPSDLEAVGEELAVHDEVAFCAAVSGSANLILAVVCRTPSDLYLYITTRIGAIAAVRTIETSPILRRIKQAATVMTSTGIAHPVHRTRQAQSVRTSSPRARRTAHDRED